MQIFPAIDLFDAKAVRLVQGDYDKMTVYNDDAVSQAMKFKAQGAEWLCFIIPKHKIIQKFIY